MDSNARPDILQDGEDSVYPLQQNTSNMYQPRFYLIVHYQEFSPCVGEDSAGETWQFNTVKKYTLFAIFIGEGSKYKMIQNENGQFDFYELCPGNGCGLPQRAQRMAFPGGSPHLP